MDFANILNDWLDRHPPQAKDEEGLAERDKRVLAARRRAALHHMRPEATLDLHGLTVAAAVERTDRFLEEAAATGLRKVLIVHGKGLHSHDEGGVLKDVVRKHIQNHPLCGETGVPERALGGEGALWVVVRQRSR